MCVNPASTSFANLRNMQIRHTTLSDITDSDNTIRAPTDMESG